MVHVMQVWLRVGLLLELASQENINGRRGYLKVTGNSIYKNNDFQVSFHIGAIFDHVNMTPK